MTAREQREEAKQDKRKEAATSFLETFLECRTQAAILNDKSDQLNARFALLNDSIAVLKLGVSAWCGFAMTSNPNGTNRYVGYTRINRAWGIAIKEVKMKDNIAVEETIWPISEAPCWLRIDTVSHLAALIIRLLEQTKDYINRTEKAIADADAVYAELLTTLPTLPTPAKLHAGDCILCGRKHSSFELLQKHWKDDHGRELPSKVLDLYDTVTMGVTCNICNRPDCDNPNGKH